MLASVVVLERRDDDCGCCLFLGDIVALFVVVYCARVSLVSSTE